MQAEALNPPPLPLALLEPARGVSELITLPLAGALLTLAPKGDGHAVITMPGFLASDISMGPIRRYLRRQGYDTRPWTLGRNMGPQVVGHEGEYLAERVLEVHKETGRKVSLIGWSLGGVMAREVAKELPNEVRQVITLGSPFAAHPDSTSVGRLYRLITRHDTSTEEFRHLMRTIEDPPEYVPSTSIFSKTDGVVSWRGSLEKPSPMTDNIEVYASHIGIGVNPLVMYLLAERLALPEDEWKPFDRQAHPLLKLAFPSSGHDY